MRGLLVIVGLPIVVATGCGEEQSSADGCVGRLSGDPIDCDNTFAVPAEDYEPAAGEREKPRPRPGRSPRRQAPVDPQPDLEPPEYQEPQPERPPRLGPPEPEGPSPLDKYLEERERERELERLEPDPYEEYLNRQECLEEAEFFNRPRWRCYNP